MLQENVDAREDKNHWKEEKNKPKIERYKIKIPMMKDERIPEDKPMENKRLK